MTSIDSVRVLLQSLPAASPAVVGSNNNAQQNELTPAKLGAGSTPLRARNSQQQQLQQQQVQQQLFFGTPEKFSSGNSASSNANDKQLRAPEEFWRDLYQFHERRG